MHDDRTVTTCGIGEYMGIITALRNTHMLIPVKSVTSGFRHMCGIGMQRKSYRHRIVGSVAFRLLSAVLRDTCARTVHGNHQAIEIRETTQGGNRYAHIGLYAAVHWQTLVYRMHSQHIATISISKNRDRIRRIKRIIALVAIGERKRKCTILLSLHGRRCLHSHIRHCIKQVTLRIDIWHLAQETVERFFSIGKCSGNVKPMLRNSHILVDIDRIICPLVPYLSCRAPRSRYLASIYRHPTIRIAT